MIELMRKRHSVRQYELKPIEEEKRIILNNLINKINQENNLNFQAFYDEPKAFNTFMAKYGKFTGVTNYIALVGTKKQEELIGYYGEAIVLKATQLGLNTCWVALTYGKNKINIKKEPHQKIICTIAIGYGKNMGVAHINKPKERVLEISQNLPSNIDLITEACLLAPTAMNQQKFKIVCDDQIKIIKSKNGFYTNVDLGIVKYHLDCIIKNDLK